MTNQSTFAILLGGDLSIDQRVRDIAKGARIFAADGGIAHAKALNVVPELWVGDFDSMTNEDLAKYGNVEKLTFARKKDETDGSLAIKAACDRGAEKIILLGALGGERSDHTLALLFEMSALHAQGTKIFATSGKEECWPIFNSSIEIDVPEGATFSVLPLSDLNGLTINGAQYPLDEIDVTFGSSYTMSNISDGKTQISVRSGRCLVLVRPHDFSGT